MMRYTIDCSPLDDGGEYSEMVRFACADLAHAELLANHLEKDTDAPALDTHYFVRSYPVVFRQQPA